MPIYEHFKPFAKETKIKRNVKMAKEDYDNSTRSLKQFIISDEFAMYNKFRKLSKEEKSKTNLKFMDKGRKWKEHFEMDGVELMAADFIDAVKIFYEYFKTTEKRCASVLNMMINICNGKVGDAYNNLKDWKEHSLEMLEILKEGSEIGIDYRITELFWGVGAKMNEGYYLRQSMLVKNAMERFEHGCFVFMLIELLRTLSVLVGKVALPYDDYMSRSWDVVKSDSTETIKSEIVSIINVFRSSETEDEEVWDYMIERAGRCPYSILGEMLEDSKEW